MIIPNAVLPLKEAHQLYSDLFLVLYGRRPQVMSNSTFYLRVDSEELMKKLVESITSRK